MSLGKVARKLKRVGKTAYQFRFTSTFEYIELNCNGTWRPENLRVIWIRSHRRVQSIDVKWIPTEDRGPNGALGRGTFDPSFAVALLVTLYGGTSGSGNLEEKEYKYYIESDGPSGKKIVASFNIDFSDYASLTGSRHTLDMSFKPVSKKITKAVLGITLQSEFIKQGNAIDDDMQSTFSAISAGQDSLQFDEDDELEADNATDGVTGKGLPQASGDLELVTLGTGERLKRTTLPNAAPLKPVRHLTPTHSPLNTPDMERKSTEVKTDNDVVEMDVQTPAKTDVTAESDLMYMNLNAEGEIDSAEGELDEPVWEGEAEAKEQMSPPREMAKDRRTSRRARREREKLEKDREKREERERKTRERREEKERKLKEKSKSPPPNVSDSPALPAREIATKLTNGTSKEEEEYDESAVMRAAEVLVTKHPNEITTCCQPIDVIFNTASAGEGSLTAVCKGTKDTAVETSVFEEGNGQYRVQFTPNQPDVFMLSVKWEGRDVPGSPFLINLNLLPQAPSSVEEEKPSNDGNTTEENIAERTRENAEENKEGVKNDRESEARHDSREIREESPAIIVSDEDPFDMANQASRILEEQQRAAMRNHVNNTSSASPPPAKPGRKVVASKEDWTPPTDHLYEDMPPAEPEETPVSPLDAWLGDAQFIDCFGEQAPREKLENAGIIGLYFSANWCPPCRRFLPKLVKFYHHLKQNQKSFELLYVSSDYSQQEMTKYMQEQQMPWLALAFESSAANNLRAAYNVSAIPILTMVNKEGVKVEERARKAVEQATSSAAVLKLYNKWLEKSQEGEGEGKEAEKKGGILKTLKSAIHKSSSKESTPERTRAGSGTLETQKSQGDSSERSRTKQKLKESSSNPPGLTVKDMEEKEEKLRHLEEVNMSLKQTNDDLNEEVAELKKQIGDFQAKLTHLEQASRQLEDEKRELMASLGTRGWLLKRGVKGPTANVWRRRYFRCDQGSKIYYYKSASEGTPQGFIDLDLVVSVQEVSPAQQDKNHATFLVQCEGRTYQLQAHDETTMRKWMSAIEYLKNWCQTNVAAETGP